MIDGLKPYPAMKDSGVPSLGEVPEHWEVRPIAGFGSLFKGNGGNKSDELEVESFDLDASQYVLANAGTDG